ncbi:hypothetical protein FQA39_LY16501 [Lamprigera yunnana]|nr:hypothetical protein FQA39_LY16501 [Lamprigera yunnana]
MKFTLHKMAPKKILQYPESTMQEALSATEKGMPVKTASKMFKVPKITLLYKLRGKNPESRKMGPAREDSSTSEPSDIEENDTPENISTFKNSLKKCKSSYVQQSGKTMNYMDVYTDSEEETDVLRNEGILSSSLHKEDVDVGIFVMVGIKSKKTFNKNKILQNQFACVTPITFLFIQYKDSD